MAKKRVTVLVYGGDREVWRGGPLRCRVLDLARHRELSNQIVPPLFELDLDVPLDAGQAYGIAVSADRHRAGWRIVSRRSFIREGDGGAEEGDGLTARLMLVHERAVCRDFEPAFERLVERGSPFARLGPEGFAALKRPEAKMAFFNIEAKLRETWVGGRRVLSFVRDVSAVAVDRVFVRTAAEAKDLVDRAPDFEDAPGHGAPHDFPGLPAHPDSWKHEKYGFGNVQLSFSAGTVAPGPEGGAERVHSVDVDVDLERDLGHAFEWIYNQVFRKKTDQTLVYGLLWDQNILPEYTLVAPATRGLVAVPNVTITVRVRRAPRRGTRRRTPKRAASKRAGPGRGATTRTTPRRRRRSAGGR